MVHVIDRQEIANSDQKHCKIYTNYTFSPNMSRETAGVDKNIAAKVALLGLPVMLPLHVPLQVPGGVETKKVLLFAIPRNFTSKVHFYD
jgi:hypothetical protein